jgi:hypothetical protein
MATISRNQTIDDGSTAVSWGAILAGATASAAITLLLLAFGTGVGFSVVSPWAGEGVSGTTFTIAGGIYLIVVAMIPATVGGYLAGRLRSQWANVHEHERYFRDSAHGFVVWAFATAVTAAVLGGAASHIIGGVGSTAAAAASTAAQSSPADLTIDRLLRTDPTPGTPAERVNQATSPTTQAEQTAAPMQGGQIAAPPPSPRNALGPNGANRGELSRILVPALAQGGSVSAPDKAYLAKLVSARTGLSQADAEKRVDEVTTQAKSTADAARKSAATFSLWLVVSMLAGALAASLAAIEGGNLRNRDWYVTASDRNHNLGIAAE